MRRKNDLLAGIHLSLFSYLHDLRPKFITVSQSAGQHGLSELHQQGDEVPHPITRVGRCGNQGHKRTRVFVLVEQGSIKTLSIARHTRQHL